MMSLPRSISILLVLMLTLAATYAVPNKPAPDMSTLLTSLTLTDDFNSPAMRNNWMIIQQIKQLPDAESQISALLVDRQQPADLRLRAAYICISLPAKNTTITDALLATVKDPDGTIRRYAITALNQREDPRVLAVLRPRLMDANAGVRAAAMLGIARLNPPDLRALAWTAYNDPDPSVQVAGIVGLGTVGDARLLDRFTAIITAAPMPARFAAYPALRRFAAPRTLPLFASALKEPDHDTRLFAVTAISYIRDKDAIPLLIQALHDDTEDVRKAAGTGLMRLRALSTSALPPLLQDPNPAVRALVLDLLIALHPADLQNLLVQSIQDVDPTVCTTAAATLAREFHDPRAVAPMIACGKGNPSYDLFNQLSAAKSPAAVDAMLKWLEDKDDLVRAYAVRMLGATGDPRALPALARHSNGTDNSIREFVDNAIQQIRLAQVSALEQDAGSTPRLLAIARDTKRSATHRLEAVRILDQRRHPEVADIIVAMLKEAHGEQFISAASLVDDPRLLEPLVTLLCKQPAKNDVPMPYDACADAFIALGATGDPRALQPLLQAWETVKIPSPYDGDIDTWKDISPKEQILLDLGKPAVDAALAMFSSNKEQQCRTAISLLASCDDPRAIPALQTALTSSDDNIRSLVIYTLANIARTADTERRRSIITTLLPLLQTHGMVQGSTIHAMATCRAAEAVPKLLAMLDEPMPKESVIRALGVIGDDQDGRVTARLLPLLYAEDGRLTAAIAAALGHLGNPKAIEPLRAITARNTEMGYADSIPYGFQLSNDQGGTLVELVRFGDGQAISTILAKCDTTFSIPNIAFTLANLLAASPKPTVTDQLLFELNKRKEETMMPIIKALGLRKDPRAVDLLITLLHEPPALFSPDYHPEIVTALGWIPDPRVLPALDDALEDGILHDTAVLALAERQDLRAVPMLIDIIATQVNTRFSQATQLRQFVLALAHYNDPRATPVLISCLHHNSVEVRRAAIDAIGQVKAESVIDPLIRCLRDDDINVRLAAAKALTAITGQTLGYHYGRWRTWRTQSSQQR